MNIIVEFQVESPVHGLMDTVLCPYHSSVKLRLPQTSNRNQLFHVSIIRVICAMKTDLILDVHFLLMIYSIQHYVIKFVIYLRQVSDFLWVLFSLGTTVSFINKTDRHNITEILLKVVLKTLMIMWSVKVWSRKKLNIKT
jgi:hypothetical protein